jgi:hypothetical protein
MAWFRSPSARYVQLFDLPENRMSSRRRSEPFSCAFLQCPLRYDGPMRLALDPFRLLLISLAGWLTQQQQDVIDYLQEENRVLREQLGGKRLSFSDNQRRRLAVRAKKLGWRMLQELTTLVKFQQSSTKCAIGIDPAGEDASSRPEAARLIQGLCHAALKPAKFGSEANFLQLNPKLKRAYCT